MEIYEQICTTYIFMVEHVSFGKRLLAILAFDEIGARNTIKTEFDVMYPGMSNTAKLIYDATVSDGCEILEV